MVVFYTDLIDTFIPLLVVMIPAIVTFSILKTKISFVAGALIGVAVGSVGTDPLLPQWAIIMGIVLLSAILFIDNQTIGT